MQNKYNDLGECTMKKTIDVGRKLTRSNRILVETAAKLGVKILKVPGKKDVLQ